MRKSVLSAAIAFVVAISGVGASPALAASSDSAKAKSKAAEKASSQLCVKVRTKVVDGQVVVRVRMGKCGKNGPPTPPPPPPDDEPM